jgi:hypothetical protein
MYLTQLNNIDFGIQIQIQIQGDKPALTPDKQSPCKTKLDRRHH